jgi:hypothetical protein
MIFSIITLLSGLSLSGISAYFSIIGLLAIFPAVFWPILVMGICVEIAKIVSTVWLKRHWRDSPVLIRIYLFSSVIVLMIMTSVSGFGFLSKSHLEQGAKTIDNGPRVERIEQQIAKEKAIIADDEKVIAQLDATINSYLGKDRTDRSVSIRRSQLPQRKQLKDEIDAANKRIDGFSEEKFKLQSEIRSLELEVGPIRYIAELIYGTEGNNTKNIESAVKIFILLIVSTLDPLAIILLVAANHTILRYQNEKKEAGILATPLEILNEEEKNTVKEDSAGEEGLSDEANATPTDVICEVFEEKPMSTAQIGTEEKIRDDINEEEAPVLEKFPDARPHPPLAVIRSPSPSKVSIEPPQGTNVEEKIQRAPAVTQANKVIPWAQQESTLRELLGSATHFIPQKANEETKSTTPGTPKTNSTIITPEVAQVEQETQSTNKETQSQESNHVTQALTEGTYKYPRALSWLKEFTRT